MVIIILLLRLLLSTRYRRGPPLQLLRISESPLLQTAGVPRCIFSLFDVRHVEDLLSETGEGLLGQLVLAAVLHKQPHDMLLEDLRCDEGDLGRINELSLVKAAGAVEVHILKGALVALSEV